MTTVPNPALRQDVVDTFERPLTTDETRVVQTWLNQAWTILTQTITGVDARLEAGTLTRDAVVQVLVAMVERKLRNPEGIRIFTGDDYGETVDATLSSGQLYVTDNEIDRLSIRVLSSGIYSIPLGP